MVDPFDKRKIEVEMLDRNNLFSIDKKDLKRLEKGLGLSYLIEQENALIRQGRRNCISVKSFNLKSITPKDQTDCSSSDSADDIQDQAENQNLDHKLKNKQRTN